MTHTHTTISGRKRLIASSLAVAASCALLLTSCAGGTDTTGPEGSNTVTIIVHDSFPVEEFEAAASAATGYDVKAITAGDGGELTNQLVLTQGAPLADMFFGVDNSFASRITEYDVAEPYLPADMPEQARQYLVDDAGSMVPIDIGATCVNIDPAWFAERGIAEPRSYEDLADPKYAGLTVLLDPTGSSTGASFLIGTIAEFGEGGYADYWKRLAANNPRLEYAWNDAYYGQFTQGGDGTYPIVVSYDSSPAWTITEDDTATTTKALLDTCSTQVEYAGLLRGGSNVEGAKAVLDFMLSREYQDTVAELHYMYPIDADATIPADWARFAPRPTKPHDLPAATIGEKREAWLKTWASATGW